MTTINPVKIAERKDAPVEDLVEMLALVKVVMKHRVAKRFARRWPKRAVRAGLRPQRRFRMLRKKWG